MKKHTLLRILLVIPIILSAVLASTQFSKAAAQAETTCYLWPMDGQVFKSSDCDSYVFVSGWIAVNKGMITDYQNGALITLAVTGKNYSRTFPPEIVETLWADPVQILAEDFGLTCTTGPYLWRARYYLPLGSLDRGIYKTVLTLEPEHPLQDGIVNNCTWSDGTPITELPALYTTTDILTNTFKVH